MEVVLHVIPFIGGGGVVAYCLAKIRRSIRVTANVWMAFLIRLPREYEIHIAFIRKK
jgi:hypothetical protein